MHTSVLLHLLVHSGSVPTMLLLNVRRLKGEGSQQCFSVSLLLFLHHSKARDMHKAQQFWARACPSKDVPSLCSPPRQACPHLACSSAG